MNENSLTARTRTILVQTAELDYSESGTFESFFSSDLKEGPGMFDIELSVSCQLADPYIQIVDQLPHAAIRAKIASKNSGLSDVQKRQAEELFEHLIRTGASRKEALEMLGPLALEITKYRCSFSVSELKWNITENLWDDRAFMSPIRR
jgi:hypothetical protein